MMLNIPDVAQQLRVTVETVNSWIEAGELPAADLGKPGSKRRRYRIAPASLDQFLAQRTKTTVNRELHARIGKIPNKFDL